jgi:hypothetical protein
LVTCSAEKVGPLVQYGNRVGRCAGPDDLLKFVAHAWLLNSKSAGSCRASVRFRLLLSFLFHIFAKVTDVAQSLSLASMGSPRMRCAPTRDRETLFCLLLVLPRLPPGRSREDPLLEAFESIHTYREGQALDLFMEMVPLHLLPSTRKKADAVSQSCTQRAVKRNGALCDVAALVTYLMLESVAFLTGAYTHAGAVQGAERANAGVGAVLRQMAVLRLASGEGPDTWLSM